jgi:hypothetical protein
MIDDFSVQQVDVVENVTMKKVVHWINDCKIGSIEVGPIV